MNKPIIAGILSGVVLLGLTVLPGMIYFSGFGPFKSWLMGYGLHFYHETQNVDNVTAGDTASFHIDCRNLGSEPITVYGVRPTCSCVAAETLPITIPGHKSATLNLIMTTQDDDQGLLKQSVELYCSPPIFPSTINISARVRKAVTNPGVSERRL